jgi:hypothetical protein
MRIVAVALDVLSPFVHDTSFPAYGLGFMSLICDEQPIRGTIEVTFISAPYLLNEALIRPIMHTRTLEQKMKRDLMTRPNATHV